MLEIKFIGMKNTYGSGAFPHFSYVLDGKEKISRMYNFEFNKLIKLYGFQEKYTIDVCGFDPLRPKFERKSKDKDLYILKENNSHRSVFGSLSHVKNWAKYRWGGTDNCTIEKFSRYFSDTLFPVKTTRGGYVELTDCDNIIRYRMQPCDYATAVVQNNYNGILKGTFKHVFIGGRILCIRLEKLENN